MRSTIENLWKNHRLPTIVGAAALVGVVLVVVGYLVLKRPDDKSCPDPCTLATTTESGPVKGTVNWPMYGLNRQRTRYLDAPEVKPPFATKWTFKGRRLLE